MRLLPPHSSTIPMSSTFTIRCGFFAIPLCCFMFSLISLWRTQALVVSTSQQIAQLKDQLLAQGASLHAINPADVSDPASSNIVSNQGPSPSPFVLYISRSLFGTHKRTLQKYFSTTTGTPFEINVHDFVDSTVTSVENFTLLESYNGNLKLSDDLTTITYTPNKWYRGFDTIMYKMEVQKDDGSTQTVSGNAKIRIRTGVVMNKLLLNPPNVYTFSEASQSQTAAIKEYFEMLHENPVVPSHDTWLDRRYKTCAVVGNGGSLRGRKRGTEIDSHDVVVRINQSPLQGYEQDVGSKLNISISNGPSSFSCWKRNETELLGNDTYEILAQASFRQHWGYIASCPKMHHHIKYLPMNYLFVDLVDQILDEYHIMMFNGTDKKYRSTGMLAVTATVLICDHVSVYGFERGPNMENNYYESDTDREWSGHSFTAEKAYFKDLAMGTGLFEPFLELYDLYTSFSYIVD